MASLGRLQALADRRQAIVDGLSKGVSEDVLRIIGNLETMLAEFLQDASSLSIEELASLNTSETLIEILDEAGLGDLVNDFKEAFAEVADNVAELLSAGGLNVSHLTLDETALEALINFKVEKAIASVRREIVDTVQTVWVESTFTGRTLKEATAQAIKTITDRTPAQAETEIGTAVSSADRVITTRVDEQREDIVYVWIGPQLDKVLRKSCSWLVGKSVTRVQLDRLDNGQLPNVIATMGGYNCRHSLAPMKRTAAERAGIPAATESDVDGFNKAANEKGRGKA